jgi:hypothetical protein
MIGFWRKWNTKKFPSLDKEGCRASDGVVGRNRCDLKISGFTNHPTAKAAPLLIQGGESLEQTN